MAEEKHVKPLKGYLGGMSIQERQEFARDCGTTWPYLRNVMYGDKRPNAALAAAIERHSSGKVKRKQLRKDWRAIWPELA